MVAGWTLCHLELLPPEPSPPVLLCSELQVGWPVQATGASLCTCWLPDRFRQWQTLARDWRVEIEINQDIPPSPFLPQVHVGHPQWLQLFPDGPSCDLDLWTPTAMCPACVSPTLDL